MNIKLDELCKRWQGWAKSTDHSENGWQSDFNQWNELMSEAQKTMLSSTQHDLDFENLELCWKISEEEELLADFSKDNLDRCLEVVRTLSKSKFPEVRWQVYDVAKYAERMGEDIVRKGLEDQDPYCRKRAIMSLAYMRPNEIATLKSRFSLDPDPHVRRAIESFPN